MANPQRYTNRAADEAAPRGQKVSD